MTAVWLMGVPWDQDRLRSIKEIREQVPDLHITWDERYDAWDTYLRNLENIGDEPAIVLEDDVILTSNWREKIEAVIAEHSSALVQFYSMRKADLTVGSRWEPGRSFLANLCFYLPAGMARDLRAFMETWEPYLTGEHPTGTDLAVADFLASRHQKYWLHVPSLVQHRQGKSVINPKRSSGRISESFVP